MEFKKPTPKKKSFLKGQLILPIKNERKVTGVFNGQFVVVRDLESMNYLYEAGNFGKGTFSRGKPNHHDKKDNLPEFILQHQFENQSKWDAGTTCSQNIQKHSGIMKDFDLSLRSISNFLQSSFDGPDKGSWKSWKETNEQEVHESSEKKKSREIDSSILEFEADESSYQDEDFKKLVKEILQTQLLKKPQKISDMQNEVVVLNTHFDAGNTDLTPENINSRLERLNTSAEENLNLNLEESFFLKSELECLNIVDLNFSELSSSELWEKFNAVDKNFKKRYVAYHYYRTKGWVVKSGLKFGGDFLLYKDGPAHFHSSYLVKILDGRKKITWREFVMMNRLVETFNKDLILCNILPSESPDEEKAFPDAFTNNAIQEVLVKRWFPSKERFSKGKDSS